MEVFVDAVIVSRIRIWSVDGAESFWWEVRDAIVDAGMGSSRRMRR